MAKDYANASLIETLADKSGREWLLAQTIEWNDEFPLGDLPTHSVLHLLSHGTDGHYNESGGGISIACGIGRDGIWSETKVDAERVAKLAKEAESAIPQSEAEFRALAEFVIYTRRAKRWAAILDGTLGTRGPRLKSAEALRFDVALELAKKAGVQFTIKTVDNGKTKTKTMSVSEVRERLSRILDNPKNARFTAEVDAETARRRATETPTVEIDLD